MLYPYNGILFSKRKWGIDIFCNRSESQNNYTEWNTSEKKYILYYFTYNIKVWGVYVEVYWEEVQWLSGMEVRARNGITKGYQESFRNAVHLRLDYLDCGDGFKTFNMYSL